MVSKKLRGMRVQGSYVSPQKAWWAVFVLFVAYIFSYVDRSIISLLVQPIKADLHISDTQVGLLTGVAFAIFYATMALPIARACDSRSRRAIVSAGVAVWSVATAASGLAGNFWHLFLARMGVGVGEAVLHPAANSLIADLFPKEKRGFPLALITASNYVGGGLALLVGGVAIAWATSLGPVGGFKPWQLVFMMVGLPGLIVALLSLTIVEPRHLQKEKPVAGSLRELFAFIHKRWFVLTCHFVGFALEGATVFGVTVWSPTFFIRHFNVSATQASYLLGPFLLVMGPLGGFIGGWLVNYWTRKGRDDAAMLTGLIGICLVWPPIALAPLMPTVFGSTLVFAFSFAAGPCCAVGALAAVQLLAPGRLRAQVVALYFFVVTIISIMGGPSIVALFTDYVFRDEAAVGSSISLTAVILGPIMSLLIFISLKSYRQAVREIEI